MTCIISLKHRGQIYIGADSAAVDDQKTYGRLDGKIIQKKKFLYGVAGSFRLIDILRFSFIPPKHPPYVEDREYLCTIFLDALRDCLKDKGFLREHETEGEQMDSSILLGYKKRVYLIDSDMQIGEPSDRYCAIGSAEQTALGAMAVLIKSGKTPLQQIKQALKIVSHHNGEIRPPFVIKKISN